MLSPAVLRVLRRKVAQAADDAFEVGADLREHVGDGARVAAEDLQPALRVGLGDPDRVPQSRTGEAHHAFAGVLQAHRHQAGQQVRRMRDEPDGPSCAAACMTTGTAPHIVTSSSAALSVSVPVSGVGVSTQVRPSNRSARTASGPFRDAPAIGWPPRTAGGGTAMIARSTAPRGASTPRHQCRPRPCRRRIDVAEVDGDAPRPQREGYGRADESRADDERGVHDAASVS